MGFGARVTSRGAAAWPGALPFPCEAAAGSAAAGACANDPAGRRRARRGRSSAGQADPAGQLGHPSSPGNSRPAPTRSC